MNSETSNGRSGHNDKMRDALSVLDDVDHYRDLHVGIVISLFLASAGLSVTACFFALELGIWLNIDNINPLIPVFISYILVFVLIVLIFLAVMSTLEAMGIRNISSVAKARLSMLTLDRYELNRLGKVIAARNWKHAYIFKTVLAGLAGCPTRGE